MMRMNTDLQRQRYYVNELLMQHEEFMIIGLTGRVGSGCSEVAKILNSNFTEIGLPHIYPGNVGFINDSERDKRILYRYASHHWLCFDIIKVRSVITSFLLKQANSLWNDIASLFSDENMDNNGVVKELLKLLQERVNNHSIYDEGQNKVIIEHLLEDNNIKQFLETVGINVEEIINEFDNEVQSWKARGDQSFNVPNIEKLFKCLYDETGNEKRYSKRKDLLEKTDILLNAFSARAASEWWKEVINQNNLKDAESFSQSISLLYEALEWEKTSALDFSKYIIVHDAIPLLSDAIHDFISEKKGSLFTELYQKYGNAIRCFGEAYVEEINLEKNIGNSIFAIPRRINQFIKSLRHPFSRTFAKPTRIVIDSIKSVLEADYLRNRYSAFYLFSISAEESVRTERLLNNKNLTIIEKDCIDWNEYSTQGAEIYSKYLKIQEDRKVDFTDSEKTTKISQLLADLEKEKTFSNAEIAFLKRVEGVSFISNAVNDPIRKEVYKNSLYRFVLQDVGASIQNADVFISNNHSGRSKNMELRWELVRNICLISHPGLLLPTPIERCMQVAFAAKANSGCLSRQVGAVVTDAEYNILSIGWNDVPCGDISCSRKNLVDVLNERDVQAYSDYELYNDDFRERIRNKYDKGVSNASEPIARVLGGLPWRYCFKDVHIDGKQPMRSRAMHAEEKALSSVQDNAIGGCLFTTSSPCEMCSKNAKNHRIKKVFYIEPYPGISEDQYSNSGDKNNRAEHILFTGAIGRAYTQMYSPIMPHKDILQFMGL